MVVFTIVGLILIVVVELRFMPRTAFIGTLALLAPRLQPLMLVKYELWASLWIPIVVVMIVAIIWDILKITGQTWTDFWELIG